MTAQERYMGEGGGCWLDICECRAHETFSCGLAFLVKENVGPL